MILFMDGFDHYGTGEVGQENMLDNVYASLGRISTRCTPVTPSFGARTGTHCLEIVGDNVITERARRVLPSAVSEAFVGFALYLPTLPNVDDSLSIFSALNGSNGFICSIVVTPTGAIKATSGDANDALLGTTAGPVLGTAAWNHVEVRVVRDAGAGIIQVRVNGVQVLNLTGLDLGSSNIAQWCAYNDEPNKNPHFYIDDLVINDTSGSYNTSWKGDLRVATLFPDADGTPSGWERVGREMYGNGVLLSDEGALFVDDQTGFALGSGDFTLEFTVKLFEEPASGRQTFAGQWDELNNQRSWILYRDHDSSGNLKLDISTDGSIGTVTNLINWSGWQPMLGRQYTISLSRVSGTLYLHIDGELQGAGVSDANTYHNSTSPLWVGGELRGTTSNVEADAFSGWYMDEFRFTVGTGRYNAANYTPASSAFPRSAPGDPDFADVQLLMGFESSPAADESSNGYTVQTSSNGEVEVQDVQGDAAGKYAVVDEAAPFDRTYIAADFLFATGELTLTANPSDTETVTLGSQTYTFVNTLTGADDVLIGADANESLENLAAAINGGSGEGSVYGTGTSQNTSASAEALGGRQLRATAATQGAAGNSVASTETLANGSWTGATLSGGADIPAAQEFEFSPLPLDTTQVKGIQLYHRSAKSDSGDCNLQSSFHVASSSANGADRAVTTAYAYWTDVFEEDPNTSAGLTVNSLVAGSFQINRTA